MENFWLFGSLAHPNSARFSALLLADFFRAYTIRQRRTSGPELKTVELSSPEHFEFLLIGILLKIKEKKYVIKRTA